MKIKFYTLNAFVKTRFGGNPAGVVFDADSLEDNQMQKIAKIIGFSETVFVSKTDSADFELRFFTPNGEVDLCGHATISAFFLMAKNKLLQTGKYTQKTKSGILGIEIKKGNTIFMNQNIPKFYDKISKIEIAESLKISKDLILPNLPIQIVSTGLKDILIPIRSIKDLHSIKPNFEKVKEISKKYDVIGYHLFTLDTLFGSIAHCRNFAPLYDIPEESATGTSNGALASYLFQYNMLDGKDLSNLFFEQGYSMKKDSEIIVDLNIKNNKIIEIKVGGIAGNIEKKEIFV